MEISHPHYRAARCGDTDAPGLCGHISFSCQDLPHILKSAALIGQHTIIFLFCFCCCYSLTECNGLFLLYEMCFLTKEIQQFYLPKTGSKIYGAKAVFMNLGMNLESPGRWVSGHVCAVGDYPDCTY